MPPKYITPIIHHSPLHIARGMHARFPNTYVSTHVNIRALIMQEKYDQPRWFIWRSLEIIPVYSRPEYYFLGTRLNIFHSGKFNLFLGMNHDERGELPDSCIFLNNCQYFISWYRWGFTKKKKKKINKKACYLYDEAW